MSAEPLAPEPNEAQPFAAASKRFLIGRPRATGEMDETLLSKKLALPIFASDPISSVAYATEAALAVLVAVSLSARHYVLPISGASAALLLIVAVAAIRKPQRIAHIFIVVTVPTRDAFIGKFPVRSVCAARFAAAERPCKVWTSAPAANVVKS